MKILRQSFPGSSLRERILAAMQDGRERTAADIARRLGLDARHVGELASEVRKLCRRGHMSHAQVSSEGASVQVYRIAQSAPKPTPTLPCMAAYARAENLAAGLSATPVNPRKQQAARVRNLIPTSINTRAAQYLAAQVEPVPVGAVADALGVDVKAAGKALRILRTQGDAAVAMVGRSTQSAVWTWIGGTGRAG